MRTEIDFLPKFTVFNAAMMLARACGLSAGATASSRSRQMMSAGPVAAFSNNGGRTPGTNNWERLSRGDVRSTVVKLIGKHPRLGDRHKAAPQKRAGS